MKQLAATVVLVAGAAVGWGVGAVLNLVLGAPSGHPSGAQVREALANAEVVIQEWIETARELGRPIPEPRGRLMFA